MTDSFLWSPPQHSSRYDLFPPKGRHAVENVPHPRTEVLVNSSGSYFMWTDAEGFNDFGISIPEWIGKK